MMIEMIEPGMWLLLGLVALLAGFIDAVAGGGGMLTVPALLSIGLPPHIALGTNKLAATFASSTAAWTYYKKQLFSPSFLAPILCSDLHWCNRRDLGCGYALNRMAGKSTAA